MIRPPGALSRRFAKIITLGAIPIVAAPRRAGLLRLRGLVPQRAGPAPAGSGRPSGGPFADRLGGQRSCRGHAGLSLSPPRGAAGRDSIEHGARGPCGGRESGAFARRHSRAARRAGRRRGARPAGGRRIHVPHRARGARDAPLPEMELRARRSSARFVALYPWSDISDMRNESVSARSARFRSWFDYSVFQFATPQQNPEHLALLDRRLSRTRAARASWSRMARRSMRAASSPPSSRATSC